MSYDSWTCLMVEKGPGILDDKVRLALKVAACDLRRRQHDRSLLSTSVCDGVIKTEWKSFAVGSRSGILFNAQITGERGDYLVNFLLGEDDLDRGAELLREKFEEGGVYIDAPQRFPVDELYKFENLHVRTSRARH